MGNANTCDGGTEEEEEEERVDGDRLESRNYEWGKKIFLFQNCSIKKGGGGEGETEKLFWSFHFMGV